MLNPPLLSRKPLGPKELIWGVLMAAGLFSGSANAASATGLVGATVVSDIVSEPSILFLQSPAFITSTPQATAQSSPSRLLYFTAQSQGSSSITTGGIRTGGVSLSSLINVDSNGIARFSITGADVTSGYTIQLPTAPSSRTQATAEESASLILPTQSFLGDQRLAVEVGQDPSQASAGPLSVQLSYN